MTYLHDTRVYHLDYQNRILFELFFNAYRTIKSVYIFENFGEYLRQLSSDKQEDKLDAYWNASYYEKLIDYVKICIAFENYNKAMLIKNGYLIHNIKSSSINKGLSKLQSQGYPIKLSDFLELNSFSSDPRKYQGEVYLSGLSENFMTVKFSHTLNDHYQKIIGLDPRFVYLLKEINEKRNRLHFFTEFIGGFSVADHIEKWTFIKECSMTLTKQAFDKAGEETPY